MLTEFKKFVEENNLFDESDRILVGVSGGVDSMVLLDLLYRIHPNIGIAHCNFQLRGKEADDDEYFVQQKSKQLNIPFYVKRFNTESVAEQLKISIQMAARKLRYNWFEEIRQKEGYDWIALGHNKNDIAETFLINLARGTGIRGLTGIRPKMKLLIRPLLFAERDHILSYMSEREIDYREDSSNKTVKYSRNKIRHNIIPHFQEINPRFLDTMTENIERMQEAYAIYKDSVGKIKKELVQESDGDFYILKSGLEKSEFRESLLFEILKSFRFNREVLFDINEQISGEPGKVFYSPTHKLVLDRKYLIVTPLVEEKERKYYIDKQQSSVNYPVSLKVRKIENIESYHIPVDSNKAAIDYDKLDFPLIIRKWQHGDYFKPFGFGHFKKLSDYFTDRKYSILDKERCWILASGEKIVWLINDRIDDRFKIDEDTRTILELTYSE